MPTWRGCARPTASVAFVPGYPFFSGAPERNALRLSFTRHPAGEIAEGLRRLRAAWDA